jgi:anthranilate synthase/aminodeoxychorismate synthase-like glutamine amidotransferase
MNLMIDHYDSFTFNLVQLISGQDREVLVRRKDEITLEEIQASRWEAIFLSPGPGSPRETGQTPEVIRKCHDAIPILGVCLGHQAIAFSFGGRVVRAERIMHGKTCPIFHDGRTLYQGLPNPFEAIRYHSLMVDRDTLPDCLEISAWSDQGEIMGLRHRDHPVEGVQFHPESILTEQGDRLIKNFFNVIQGGRTNGN